MPYRAIAHRVVAFRPGLVKRIYADAGQISTGDLPSFINLPERNEACQAGKRLPNGPSGPSPSWQQSGSSRALSHAACRRSEKATGEGRFTLGFSSFPNHPYKPQRTILWVASSHPKLKGLSAALCGPSRERVGPLSFLVCEPCRRGAHIDCESVPWCECPDVKCAQTVTSNPSKFEESLEGIRMGSRRKRLLLLSHCRTSRCTGCARMGS